MDHNTMLEKYHSPPGFKPKAYLLASGWKTSEIERYLGDPDRHDTNPHGGSDIALYSDTRIRKANKERQASFIMPTPEFAEIMGGIDLALQDDEHSVVETLTKEQLGVHWLQGNNSARLHEHKVKEMRDDWDAMAVTTLLADYANGAYLLLDGQKRRLAAPAGFLFTVVVVHGLTPDRSADLWDKVNVRRTAKNAYQKYHNDIVRNTPYAVELQAMIEKIDRKVGTAGPNTFSCVAYAQHLLETPKAANAFRNMFPIIAELCAGQVISDQIVRGVVEIERRIEGTGESLTSPTRRERLLTRSYKDIRAAVKPLKNNKGSEKKHAEVILEIFNKDLRKHKLIVPGINDND